MNSARIYAYRLLTALIPETSCFGLKAAALKWCGAKVGRNVRIGSSARFLGTGALVIGLLCGRWTLMALGDVDRGLMTGCW